MVHQNLTENDGAAAEILVAPKTCFFSHNDSHTNPLKRQISTHLYAQATPGKVSLNEM